MAGEQDPLAAPERREFIGHTFHGALPLAQSSSSMVLVAQRVHRLPEAVVLVGHQLAVGGQALERLAFPARCVALDVVRGTCGDSTKKPPLIQPPSPRGFSVKLVTRAPSSCSAPKRPGGCTAVTVASLPCGWWKAIVARMSMSATPSP